MTWRSEFVEMGGYDCMTDAIRIFSGDILIVSLDLGDYGQATGCEKNPEARKTAEEYASRIVAAVNSYDAHRKLAAISRQIADEPCDHGPTLLCPREALREALKAVEETDK